MRGLTHTRASGCGLHASLTNGIGARVLLSSIYPMPLDILSLLFEKWFGRGSQSFMVMVAKMNCVDRPQAMNISGPSPSIICCSKFRIFMDLTDPDLK